MLRRTYLAVSGKRDGFVLVRRIKSVCLFVIYFSTLLFVHLESVFRPEARRHVTSIGSESLVYVCVFVGFFVCVLLNSKVKKVSYRSHTLISSTNYLQYVQRKEENPEPKRIFNVGVFVFLFFLIYLLST